MWMEDAPENLRTRWYNGSSSVPSLGEKILDANFLSIDEWFQELLRFVIYSIAPFPLLMNDAITRP